MGRISLYRQIGIAGLSCVLLAVAVMLAPFDQGSVRAPSLENAGSGLLSPGLSAVVPFAEQESSH